MLRVLDMLPGNGLYLIGNRLALKARIGRGWIERFGRMGPEWSMLTDTEFADFYSHVRASDFPQLRRSP